MLIRNFRTSFLSCYHLNLVIRETSGEIMQLCSEWGRDGGRGHWGARKGGEGGRLVGVLLNTNKLALSVQQKSRCLF